MDFPQVNEVYSLINDKLEIWLEEGIKLLPNLVVAIFIAILFGIVSKIAGKLIQRLLRSAFESRQIADLITAIFKVIILVAGMFIALDFVGLQGTVTSLLAGAGIVGLAIGFAFQDITENFIAGIAMGIRKPFQIGDVIEAEGVFGNVEAINLRNTLVTTFHGQREIIPNKILFRNVMTNYSALGVRRIEIPVGISYADDPARTRDILKETLNKKDYVINKEETTVYAKGFGDSSIDLLVWFWIKYPGETGFMEARHDAVVAIHRALKDADILIPFPIRTLDFDAKGGTKLDTMLSSGQSETHSDNDANIRSSANSNSSAEASNADADR